MSDLYRLWQMSWSDPWNAGRDTEVGTAKAATEK